MLTAVVSVETVLLVLLVVLVAALLRSHAEILRRLGPEGSRPESWVDRSQGLAPPRARSGGEAPAPALAGVTLAGDAVRLAFDGRGSSPTLLAFLSSGCTSCGQFWDALAERRLPDGLETVIVTRGSEREQQVKLRSLAPAGVPVVMSSAAWEDYGVPGTPYFVLIESGMLAGEGVATTWQALSSLVVDALAEQTEAEPAGGSERHRRIDETLAGAGIGPDHPSLYPGREG
jgi:hypothetical protein